MDLESGSRSNGNLDGIRLKEQMEREKERTRELELQIRDHNFQVKDKDKAIDKHKKGNFFKFCQQKTIVENK